MPLQTFAYVSSHDLQEPLRKIQSFAGYLMDTEAGKLSPRGQDYFLRMRNAANRMQALIEDLLTFSRLNSADFTFEQTNLNELLSSVLQELQERIEQKGTAIQRNVLPTLSLVAFQMHQLLQNLLTNALKFSRKGVAPDIRITARKVQAGSVSSMELPEGTWWKITVKDNGVGFEEQYKERIFEVFQRLHGKLDYEGTGIGLSIVKKIAENHHGYITATGRPGKGASFTLFLPA